MNEPNLQDLTTNKELKKLLSYPKLLALLVKDPVDLTLRQYGQLADAQIYTIDRWSTLKVILDRAAIWIGKSSSDITPPWPKFPPEKPSAIKQPVYGNSK